MKRYRYQAFFLGVFFAWLYHRTASFFFSYDSLCYALDVEKKSLAGTLHPFHMLPSFVNALAFHLCMALGHPRRALFITQHLNAVVAGAAIALLSWMLERRYGWKAALLGCLCFGFSAAFWTEAVDPGVYAWAGFFTCLLLAGALGEIPLPAWGVGVLHGVAILFYQMLLWTVPAVLLRQQARDRAKYLTGLTLSAGLIYGAIGWGYHGPSWKNVMDWFMSPATRPGTHPFQGNYWNLNFLEGCTSSAQALAYSLVVPTGGGTYLAWFLMIVGVVLALYGSWWFWKESFERRMNLMFLWLWILGLSLFFFVYAQGAIHFRILLLPAAIMLLMEVSSLRPKLWNFRLSVTVLAVMALVNFTQVIRPAMNALQSPSFIRSLWIAQHVSSRDFFLFAGIGDSSITNVYMAYFAPQVPARSMQGYFFGNLGGDLKEITQSIEQVRIRRGRLWMESCLRDADVQAKLERSGAIPSGTITRWLSRWKIIRVERGPLDYFIDQVVAF